MTSCHTAAAAHHAAAAAEHAAEAARHAAAAGTPCGPCPGGAGGLSADPLLHRVTVAGDAVATGVAAGPPCAGGGGGGACGPGAGAPCGGGGGGGGACGPGAVGGDGAASGPGGSCGAGGGCADPSSGGSGGGGGECAGGGSSCGGAGSGADSTGVRGDGACGDGTCGDGDAGARGDGKEREPKHHEDKGPGLAGDLLGAAGIGLDVGGIAARRKNEDRLHMSKEEKKERTGAGLKKAGLIGGAAVGGMAAGKGLEHLGAPLGAGVVGMGLAVGAAGVLTSDDGMSKKDKAKAAVAAGGAAALLGGAHMAAGRVIGPELGFGVGAIVGRVAGAAAVTKGRERMLAMRDGFAEGVTLVAAGVGIRAAFGAFAPLPLGVVNEYKRKGLEFSGGHVLAVGKRKLEEKKEAGETRRGVAEEAVLELQREEKGCQVRVGGGAVLMPIGLAMGGIVGGAVGAGVGGLVGVGGNVGITKKKEVQLEEGMQKAKGEKMKGLSGGFDVVGLEWLNLDTGKMTHCRVEVTEDGEYSIDEGTCLMLFGKKVWSFSNPEWRQKLKPGKKVMLFIKVPGQNKVVWVPAEVTTRWKNAVSVKYGEGDNEVRRIISLNSKAICQPLLPVASDPGKEVAVA